MAANQFSVSDETAEKILDTFKKTRLLGENWGETKKTYALCVLRDGSNNVILKDSSGKHAELNVTDHLNALHAEGQNLKGQEFEKKSSLSETHLTMFINYSPCGRKVKIKRNGVEEVKKMPNCCQHLIDYINSQNSYIDSLEIVFAGLYCDGDEEALKSLHNHPKITLSTFKGKMKGRVLKGVS